MTPRKGTVMSDAHLAYWPPNKPRHLEIPATSIVGNLERATARTPDKPCLVFYGASKSYAQVYGEVEALAGYLQRRAGVQRGDRVMLDLQNSPQWVVAYYAILRADAVVVPVNPMNTTHELAAVLDDCGARVAIVGQEVLPRIAPLLGTTLDHAVVATYADALPDTIDMPVPAFVTTPRQPLSAAGVVAWNDALARGESPGAHAAGPDDLCVMPYTSGTTGRPKGCMHTHRSVMFNAVSGLEWFERGPQDTVYLAVLPYFHVTGMEGSMNTPIFGGSTIVIQPRWDRDAAAMNVERHRVSAWQLISTMVVDFLSNPDLARYDLSSLRRVSGGGAAMPEAIAAKLRDLCGLDYIEGYGLSETIAQTHINPQHRPKKQCLGIPIFDTIARVVDPATLVPVPPGEVGEVLVAGPQLMQGYWNQPEATRAAFVACDGRRFLRTGDLARVDEDGYFFMVDRLKRMINCSGFKVWPAEVESMMYAHPDIAEACVISARDAKRGETVKAVVVLKPGRAGHVNEQQILDWAQARMAAYKRPRIVEFVESLPKSGTGKVQWRALQERESARETVPTSTGAASALQNEMRVTSAFPGETRDTTDAENGTGFQKRLTLVSASPTIHAIRGVAFEQRRTDGTGDAAVTVHSES